MTQRSRLACKVVVLGRRHRHLLRGLPGFTGERQARRGEFDRCASGHGDLNRHFAHRLGAERDRVRTLAAFGNRQRRLGDKERRLEHDFRLDDRQGAFAAAHRTAREPRSGHAIEHVERNRNGLVLGFGHVVGDRRHGQRRGVRRARAASEGDHGGGINAAVGDTERQLARRAEAVVRAQGGAAAERQGYWQRFARDERASQTDSEHGAAARFGKAVRWHIERHGGRIVVRHDNACRIARRGSERIAAASLHGGAHRTVGFVEVIPRRGDAQHRGGFAGFDRCFKGRHRRVGQESALLGDRHAHREIALGRRVREQREQRLAAFDDRRVRGDRHFRSAARHWIDRLRRLDDIDIDRLATDGAATRRNVLVRRDTDA